ncbi:MAG: glycoside hydrolase family 99-like domain-containing protein [Bacteroidota bacterium]
MRITKILAIGMFAALLSAGAACQKQQPAGGTPTIIQPVNTGGNTQSYEYSGPGEYNIGVFYYPGWRDNINASNPLPWNQIKAFPEREPLLGWYKEGEIALAEQQIQWMHDYGIDFVVYDWYWNKGNYEDNGHALQAYLAAKNKNLLKFSLLWDNASTATLNETQFTSMVKNWITTCFSQPQFLKVNGMPLVYIFSISNLHEDAKKFGMTSKQLLDEADAMAKAAGYAGISFVANTTGQPGDEYWLDYGAKNSYDLFSAYNYHRGPDINTQSQSYQELSDGYLAHWKFVINKTQGLNFIVPMTSGWNRKPWGGSSNPLHDNSVSTPESFEQHLARAKAFMDENPQKTMKMGVICAWNEFGEGSYIEPTKTFQTQYLEKVKKVFGTQ